MEVPLFFKGLNLVCRKNVNGTVGFELNNPVLLSIQSKVVSLPDEETGTEAAASLADDNAAGAHELAAVNLHTEPLWI